MGLDNDIGWSCSKQITVWSSAHCSKPVYQCDIEEKKSEYMIYVRDLKIAFFFYKEIIEMRFIKA